MSYLDAYTICCPECGFTARGDVFDPSCADECFCPECEEKFLFEADEFETDEFDEEDEDEDEPHPTADEGE